MVGKGPADAIIVLGRVDEFGSLTIDAHERIRKAAHLYKEGVAPLLIAPAKWSYRLQHIPPCTEATIIKARLMEWGIPDSAIACEEKSCDTLGAAYFLKIDFAIPRKWRKIIVVTSLDHLEKTEYVFTKVFGEDCCLEFSCGNRVLSDDVYEQTLEREHKVIKLMQETWLGPVNPGDHEHIAKVLDKHPGYNQNAELSVGKMTERIARQTL